MDPAKELKHAEEELLKLEQKKHEIERQMRGWIQIIEGLRLLNPGEQNTAHDPATFEGLAAETDTPNLPSKILSVLCEAGGPIPAPQIRDILVASRAVDASSKNLLISIHTTLKRLMKTGQVEELPFSETSKLYRYVSPMEQALNAAPPLEQALNRTSSLSWVYGSGMRGDEKPRDLSHPYRPGTYVDVSGKERK